jgi:tellurite methyltransferase
MLPIPDNPVGEWADYFESTLSKPLHPLFHLLEPYLPETGVAADLGCGVGHAVVWLADKGWEVDATDGHGQALKIVSSRLSPEARQRVRLHEAMLEDAELEPGKYDLVIAAYSLFFVRSDEALREIWNRIGKGLKPDGLFVGEFLGKNDDWAPDFLHHTADQVRDFLSGWEVLHWDEAEQDGHTSQGTEKHWHVFHVIARKT